jgi:predicted ATPase
MGNFKRAQQATDRMLLAYDPEQHGNLVHTYNYDPKCFVLAGAAQWLWLLGYPDKARQAVLDGLDIARGLGHAFNLVHVLSTGTFALQWRGETHLARQWLAEAYAIAREHGMNIADTMVAVFDGRALVEQGDHAEGYAKMTFGNELWRQAGGVAGVPGGNMMRARALAGLKRFDEAKSLLDEALELIEQTSHRLEEAEVYRVLGELLQRQPTPDVDASEGAFLKALEVARSQEARGWELRAATSLARLWQAQGRCKDALDLLGPIYKWFTEGFGTRDLKAARELLEELG